MVISEAEEIRRVQMTNQQIRKLATAFSPGSPPPPFSLHKVSVSVV